MPPPRVASRARRGRAAESGGAPAAVDQERREARRRGPGHVGRGVVAHVDAARGLHAETLERDLERPRVGLGDADGGGRDDDLEEPGEPDARKHVVQRDVPVGDDGELEAGGSQALERGLGVGVGVERDGVGQRGQELGAGDVDRERVGEQGRALQPQRGQRQGVGAQRCNGRGSGASRPASPPRSARGRRARPRRRSSDRCRRGAGGSMATSVPIASNVTAPRSVTP